MAIPKIEEIADMSFVDYYDLMKEQLTLQEAYAVRGMLAFIDTDLQCLFAQYTRDFGSTAQEVADNISRVVSIGVKLELIRQKRLFTDKILRERTPDCFKS